MVGEEVVMPENTYPWVHNPMVWIDQSMDGDGNSADLRARAKKVLNLAELRNLT